MSSRFLRLKFESKKGLRPNSLRNKRRGLQLSYIPAVPGTSQLFENFNFCRATEMSNKWYAPNKYITETLFKVWKFYIYWICLIIIMCFFHETLSIEQHVIFRVNLSTQWRVWDSFIGFFCTIFFEKFPPPFGRGGGDFSRFMHKLAPSLHF